MNPAADVRRMDTAKMPWSLLRSRAERSSTGFHGTTDKSLIYKCVNGMCAAAVTGDKFLARQRGESLRGML